MAGVTNGALWYRGWCHSDFDSGIDGSLIIDSGASAELTPDDAHAIMDIYIARLEALYPGATFTLTTLTEYTQSQTDIT